MSRDEEKLCTVCSSPLPTQNGPGRRRKVCRDEDSPTPGGCARWRDMERRTRAHPDRPTSHRHSGTNVFTLFPNGGFLIE